jgi:hopanoid biosynthesis associated protein HpnK
VYAYPQPQRTQRAHLENSVICVISVVTMLLPAVQRVIINADDFGLSPGVNRGIVAAFLDGILTSTTMLVNLPSFDDAVALALSHPTLPVGIHLSLLWGRPVSDPAVVPSLVERDGTFPRSLTVLVRRYVLGTLNLEHVRTEFRAQIERFRRTGLTPSHVDSHKHVHCLPGVLSALADVSSEQGIRRARFPYEDGLAPSIGTVDVAPAGSTKSRMKSAVVRFLSRGGRKTLDRRGIRTTDHFVGIQYMDRLDADTMRFILSNLRDGSTELMCHPGYDDGLARRYSGVPPHRDAELAALQNAAVKECLTARGIRRISYNDI